MSVLREHHEGASLRQLLTLIPEETHWVWRMLPLFEKHRNQEVYAFMGTCRKFDKNQDFLAVLHAERDLTLQLLSAIQEISDRPIILFDMRVMWRTYRDTKEPEAPTSQDSNQTSVIV